MSDESQDVTTAGTAGMSDEPHDQIDPNDTIVIQPDPNIPHDDSVAQGANDGYALDDQEHHVDGDEHPDDNRRLSGQTLVEEPGSENSSQTLVENDNASVRTGTNNVDPESQKENQKPNPMGLVGPIIGLFLLFLTFVLLIFPAFSTPMIRPIYLYRLDGEIGGPSNLSSTTTSINFGAWGFCSAGLVQSIGIGPFKKTFRTAGQCSPIELGWNFADLPGFNSIPGISGSISHVATGFLILHLVAWIFVLLSLCVNAAGAFVPQLFSKAPQHHDDKQIDQQTQQQTEPQTDASNGEVKPGDDARSVKTITEEQQQTDDTKSVKTVRSEGGAKPEDQGDQEHPDAHDPDNSDAHDSEHPDAHDPDHDPESQEHNEKMEEVPLDQNQNLSGNPVNGDNPDRPPEGDATGTEQPPSSSSPPPSPEDTVVEHKTPVLHITLPGLVCGIAAIFVTIVFFLDLGILGVTNHEVKKDSGGLASFHLGPAFWFVFGALITNWLAFAVLLLDMTVLIGSLNKSGSNANAPQADGQNPTDGGDNSAETRSIAKSEEIPDEHREAGGQGDPTVTANPDVENQEKRESVVSQYSQPPEPTAKPVEEQDVVPQPVQGDETVQQEAPLENA